MNGNNLLPVDPTIEGTITWEDDLSQELSRSGLQQAGEILRVMQASGEAFRRMPPDYNACLSNARVTLETLARDIAKSRQSRHPGSFDETRWGQVVAYLRTSGLISVQEEEGITGVFTFVSPGAHAPVGLDESEMARLGRSLVASMCYFLVKRHNSDRA